MLVAALAAWSVPSHAQGEVNVYSARQENLIRPQLDAFTKETGIKVNLITASEDQLLERMRAEGRNSPADVLLTVDVARLIRAKDAGVLKPIKSAVLEQAIPAQYRDADGAWYGLGLRARVLFYNPQNITTAELRDYEGLADPKWRGRVCIRSSGHPYNQSLLASLIAHHGAPAAERWAAGMVANMGRPPQGGDRDQIAAVASGECDVAVANTYYYVLMQTGTEAEKEAASKVRLFWPNQNDRGTHVNISGGGIAAFAPHAEEGQKLLEFLSGESTQEIYADVVYEYPVRAGVPISSRLKALGPLAPDKLPLAELAAHQAEAVRIFDRVGWK